ncbi:succinate-semialdehyde dehydrogenase (NADP(+)) [Nocardioides pocheonensis]|uniref:Succinate-semialdehyde dehydrogenase (NADP(+)) n=1 Tax=Nocardioides pocheonensis TaxID=661485 RepID=A0A3N0GWH8_9ACTN|nr:succinate-semialdehyde dehydrogenase (NADP(+)) [Nocardioides pocheonensis]
MVEPAETPGPRVVEPAETPSRVDAAYVEALLRWVTSSSGETASALAPFTGDPLPAVPQSSAADVRAAAARARSAQAAWAALPLAERLRPLIRFAELVLKEKDRLLDVVQWETGKSRVHGSIELLGLPAVTAHYAHNAADYLAERPVLSGTPGLVRTRVAHRPKGLVGVIAPWNYPLFLAVGDVIPALVAGNAVLSKADSQAPLSLLAARELAARAGLPDDVWQVVAGRGSVIGPALIDEVDHLAFTGSTATGRELAAACGRRLIGTSMELGGKNPMIVRADADLDAAVTGAVQACFSNAGQICIGIERIYVHESRYAAFVDAFALATKGIRLGAAYDFSVEMGSLTSAEQLEVTRRHVDDAVAKGAKVVAGGRARPDLGPLFFEPTVLVDVTPAMTAYADETFGPVVAVYPVVDDEDAIARANDTDYGLSASIWSRDVETARLMAARIRAGSVNVNDGYVAAIGSVSAPMGGMGASGVGRRHGPDGLLRYTETQTVATQKRALPYPVKPKGFLAAGAAALRAQLAAARLRNRRSTR